jgi:hypothetical protein
MVGKYHSPSRRAKQTAVSPLVSCVSSHFLLPTLFTIVYIHLSKTCKNYFLSHLFSIPTCNLLNLNDNDTPTVATAYSIALALAHSIISSISKSSSSLSHNITLGN